MTKMDIRFENKVKTELFCNIMIGECFAVAIHTPDEMICMKINSPEACNDNAVDLMSGETYQFEDGDEVIPVRTELTARLDG